MRKVLWRDGVLREIVTPLCPDNHNRHTRASHPPTNLREEVSMTSAEPNLESRTRTLFCKSRRAKQVNRVCVAGAGHRTYHLQIRYGHVEVLREVGVPHQTHLQCERTEITTTRQIHSVGHDARWWWRRYRGCPGRYLDSTHPVSVRVDALCPVLRI